MKVLPIAAGSLVLVAAAVSSVQAIAARQDRGQDMPMSGEAMEMMAKVKELAAPGEHHRHLQKMVGEWDNRYQMRWDPQSDWIETEGTSEIVPMLDGRYVREEVEFTVMGEPVEGVHILGYDNMKEEFVSIWMDSMSTWPVMSRGNANAEGVVDMRGTMVDAMGERPFRMEIRHEGDDKVHVTMYDTIPDHGEVAVMKIESTRRK